MCDLIGRTRASVKFEKSDVSSSPQCVVAAGMKRQDLCSDSDKKWLTASEKAIRALEEAAFEHEDTGKRIASEIRSRIRSNIAKQINALVTEIRDTLGQLDLKCGKNEGDEISRDLMNIVAEQQSLVDSAEACPVKPLVHFGLSRPRRVNVTPPSRPLKETQHILAARVQQFESNQEPRAKRETKPLAAVPRRLQYRKMFARKEDEDFMVHLPRARSAAPPSNRAKPAPNVPKIQKRSGNKLTESQLSRSDEDVSSIERSAPKMQDLAKERASLLAAQLVENRIFASRAAQNANAVDENNVVDKRRLSCFGFVRKTIAENDERLGGGVSGLTVKQRAKLYDKGSGPT